MKLRNILQYLFGHQSHMPTNTQSKSDPENPQATQVVQVAPKHRFPEFQYTSKCRFVTINGLDNFCDSQAFIEWTTTTKKTSDYFLFSMGRLRKYARDKFNIELIVTEYVLKQMYQDGVLSYYVPNASPQDFDLATKTLLDPHVIIGDEETEANIFAPGKGPYLTMGKDFDPQTNNFTVTCIDLSELSAKIESDAPTKEIDSMMALALRQLCKCNPNRSSRYKWPEIVRYSITDSNNITPSKPLDDIADRCFDEESQKLISEIQERIEILKQKGYALYILQKLNPLPDTPSNLCITKSFRIFLADYGNKEILMTPLVKAVFFIFLKHPEGIAFKMLSDYRTELLKIYTEIKHKKPTPEEVESIKRLTDPTNNSINEKCARIREAFVKVMCEDYVKPYIVQGKRGEPKKITLDREYLQWECEDPIFADVK